MQAAIVTPVFDKVYQSIFDTLEPIREKELKGIQLTENLNPKPKKKKRRSGRLMKYQMTIPANLKPVLQKMVQVIRTKNQNNQ